MSDKPPANPDDLTAAARKFSAVAGEIQNLHDVLTHRTQDLVTGSDAWAGAGSEQFQVAWERFSDDTLNAAATLTRAAGVLNELAKDIANVQASPSGRLVRAVNTGRVKVVPDSVHILIPGAGVIHASEATNAETDVSDGYDEAATSAAIGFDGAAHATIVSQVSGGVDSTAAGLADTGWTNTTPAGAAESATATASAPAAASAADRTTQQARRSEKTDTSAPVAPGFFTTGASDGGAAATDGATEWGAPGGAETAPASDSAPGSTAAPGDGATDGKAKGRNRTRADLGTSPSDATLAAARRQGSDATMTV